MPVINIDGPAIKDIEKKRTLVKELTDAAVKAYGLPRGSIIVLVKENSPENVGVGGELVSDRK
jgi:4-oxalocrotonate tautomerase